MTNFAILTDSCSDLTAPLRERFGVDGYVPGALVYPDGSNHDTRAVFRHDEG